MSTSGNPGTGGGSRAYTGSGNNPSQANGSNYVDICGLNPATTYYFTCTSYCDALGWGSSYNISAMTRKTAQQMLDPRPASKPSIYSYLCKYTTSPTATYVQTEATVVDNVMEFTFRAISSPGDSVQAFCEGNGLNMMNVKWENMSQSDIAEFKKYRIRVYANDSIIMDVAPGSWDLVARTFYKSWDSTLVYIPDFRGTINAKCGYSGKKFRVEFI